MSTPKPNTLAFRTLFILTLLSGASTFLSPLSGDYWPVILEFIGSFHPVVLHLPIGLWGGVLLLLCFDRSQSQSSRQRLFWASIATAATSIVAFFTGLTLFLAGSYGSDTVSPHMYGAFTFLLATIAFTFFTGRVDFGKWLWPAALLTTCTLIYAGHIGGVITHGEPLDKAPWTVFENRAAEKERALHARANREPLVFEDIVIPIFEEKCLNCHGTERAKGKLRMDSLAALLDGGSKGPALVPGDPHASLLVERMRLPESDKERMPPIDKPQLTEPEIAFLEWWTEHGHQAQLKAADASVPVALKPLVQSFIGDDPEAIRRREQLKLKKQLLLHYAEFSKTYPGVLTQSVVGEPIFELSAASFFGLDEVKLREALQPLAPYLVRIDWIGRPLNPEWQQIFLEAKNLRTLNLNQSTVTSDQLQALLERHKKLRKLNLFATPIDDQALPALIPPVSKGQLSSLILAETQLSPDAFQQIRSAIPQIQVILQ